MTTAETHNTSEYAALLRADFASFAQQCFRELNPRSQLALSWFHDILAAKLEAVRTGRSRRVIINMPPRHLKSHLASICFPAWCLGHDPSAQLLCVTPGFQRRRSVASVARGPGPRRQTVARLPADRRQQLVPAAFCHPPFAAAPSDVRIRDHGVGLPARDLGRWGADRTRARNLAPAFLRLSRPRGRVKVDSIMAIFGLPSSGANGFSPTSIETP